MKRVAHGGRVLVAVLLMLLTAPAARAQFGPPGLSRGPSDLTELAARRDAVAACCDLLGMDADRRQLAMELHAAYLERFGEMAASFESQTARLQQQMRQTGDASDFQRRAPQLMRELMSRMRELDDGFYLDLQALAGVEADDARWAAVERLRRREEAKHTPSINGDAVDLVAVLGRVQPQEAWSADLSAAALRYELELDSALRERQRLVRDAMLKTGDLLEAQFDPARQEEAATYWGRFLEQMQALALRAKRTNVRCAAELEQLLEGELRSAFALEARRAMWPGVYRASQPQRLLAAAGRMPDLTAEQRAQLEAIEQEYEAAATAINDRWRRLIDEREEEAEGPMGGFVVPETGAASEEAQAKRQRADLDSATSSRIRNILTEAQQAKLPDDVDDGGEDHG